MWLHVWRCSSAESQTMNARQANAGSCQNAGSNQSAGQSGIQDAGSNQKAS